MWMRTLFWRDEIMNHSSPLTTKAKVVDERVEWKKANKPKLTEAVAKRILGVDCVGRTGIRWTEHWIETFLRERSLPLSLLGPGFLPGLQTLYPLDEAVAIVERLRTEFVSIQGDTPQSVQDHSLLRALKSRNTSHPQTSLETSESPPEE